MAVLAELLAQEAALVQDFIATLNREQEALKRGEIDKLGPITATKTELVDKLNAAEKERGVLLQRAGHSADREGMLAWLARNQGDRATAAGWTKLLELASEAKRLHDLNGRLIAIRLQATNQALGVLTQQSQRSTLYGRDGLATPRTGSRIIDAA